MGLFVKLQRLCRVDKFPLENFHTEIVAQVLRNSPALTLDWLSHIQPAMLVNPAIEIETQEQFVKLADHATDSRPDITIRLTEGDRKELVLIESKLQAKEGPNQLRRYAEQLAERKDLTRTALVFITRDFEPIPDVEFEGLPTNFTFKQKRWFEFYEILKAHVNGDGLATELRLFMEENNMSLRNQFRAIDMLALENFWGAKALMDETLWTDVNKKYDEILCKPGSRRRAGSILTKDPWYGMKVDFGKNCDFNCQLGYWLPSGDPSGDVWLGVAMYSNPKSAIRKKVIEAFRNFSRESQEVWKAQELDKENEWSSIETGRYLQEFLGENDHIKVIKEYFLNALKDVKKFKEKHPELPWADQAPEEKDDN